MLSINDFNIIKEKAFCCVPYQYKNICNIYPYTVQEIIEMGTDKYFSSLGILILTKDDIAEIIKKKTNQSLKDEEVPEPFEYLIKSSELNDMFFLELQDIFSTFLKEDVLILPELNVVVVGDPKDKRFITSENFSDIQDILRIQNRKDVSPPPPPDETPGQRKMRLLREKTAKILFFFAFSALDHAPFYLAHSLWNIFFCHLLMNFAGAGCLRGLVVPVLIIERVERFFELAICSCTRSHRRSI